MKNLSNQSLSACPKNIKKNFQPNIWAIYKSGQQEKSTKQFIYLDYKKNLWTLSKQKQLQQINYKSQQNKSQKPNSLYLISTSHLRALYPSQMTPPHSHKDSSYAADRSIHTPISVTSSLDRLVSLTQPMKNKIKLKSRYSLTQPVDFFFFFSFE